ncbi:MAG: hypothetical protein AAF125_14155 [Chloroflexota bacterium]
MMIALQPRDYTEEHPYGGYILEIKDDNREMICEIEIDVSTKTGGMTVQKWKHSTRKKDEGKRVIGIYYYISMMGHELDQWRYYDLDKAKDVT